MPKDTNDYVVTIADALGYAAPYDQPTPAGACPCPRPATVTSMALYRVAPAGTPKDKLLLAKDIVTRAANLVAAGNWVQGVFATDDINDECEPLHPRARAWGIGGALVKSIGHVRPATNSAGRIAWNIVAHSVRARHGCSMGWFNDAHAMTGGDVAAELNAAADAIDEIIATRGL